MIQQFTVGRRNPGHWDVMTKDGRAFRIRGGPGHYVVHDEREGKGANDTRSPFKTVTACMVYICDEFMHEVIAAEGQEVTTIESWNIPRQIR